MLDSIPRGSISKLVLAVAVLGAPIAAAPFYSGVYVPFSGHPCSAGGYWETFTYAYGQPNLPNFGGSALLEQLVPGAVIDGQGNIDNPSAASSFRITETVPGDLQDVVLQLSIFGGPIDGSTFVLKYVDSSSVTHSIVPGSSQLTGGGPGGSVESLITWELSSVADTITAYEIDFAAAQPGMQLDAAWLHSRYAGSTGSTFCAGDGAGSACPCAPGALAHGCRNSYPFGVGCMLAAEGNANVANDTLVFAAWYVSPNTSALWFQGSASVPAGLGVPFGDGLRCAGGNVVRLGTTTSIGDLSYFGHGWGSSISGLGHITVPGVTRYYQLWYRDAASYCTSATFNLSNGIAITW